MIVMMCAWHAHSQAVITALPRWMVSAHFNYVFPQEPINRYLERNNVGYTIEAQYRIQYNKPFMLGVHYTETGVSRYAFKYVDNAGVNIRERAYTRRIEPGLAFGFYPEINWLLQPYLQAHAGMVIYQTSSILRDTDSEEVIERISENTSTAPSYSLDLGIHIVPNIWYLRGDIRIGFTTNPSLDYMVLNEEEKGTTGFPIDYFDLHTSAARWLKISAGITYMF